MKQLGRLFCFEWKKIWKRKSTWITLGILIGMQLVMMSASFFGSIYVEGEFLETHMQGIRIDKENGRKLSGRKIDDSLLEEMRDAYARVPMGKNDMKYLLTEEYQKNVRPYSMAYRFIQLMAYGSQFERDPLQATEEQLYQARDEVAAANWESFGLKDREKEYWQKREERIAKPFVYQYVEGYDYLISMSGIYLAGMLMAFLLAVCAGNIFAEEHNRRTDQLILCSKLGRQQIYFAKIMAGSLFSLAAACILFLLVLLYSAVVYGLDGFSTAIQNIWPGCSEMLTVGQVLAIMVGVFLLSSVVTCVFAMVFSEVTRSNVASIATIIAITFLSRLIPIPYRFRLLSQLWNCWPLNLLKFDQGFTDLRLINLFGMELTLWQFAPVLYVLAGGMLVWAGKKVYCRYQVQGR